MTLTLKSLYKMDSTGKIRVWSIRTELRNGIPHYVQEHGVLDGKMQETATAVRDGKNISRTNETTASEQCDAEAQSLWTKQRDRKGYSETIPDNRPKLPMLAKTFDKDSKKIAWPAATQPKLDGIRCMATFCNGKIVLKSRTGKEFKALGHIKEAIIKAMPSLKQGITFDGELYNHNFKDDFQRLVSAIKRDDPSLETKYIQYHIYDYFDRSDFEERSKFLSMTVKPHESIMLVPTYRVNNIDDFKVRYGEFVESGYEGAMIRNLKGPYEENRRSPNLQKFKEFVDQEFTIVGAYENKGKQEGQCTFICVTAEGAEFGVKPKGSDEQRRKYWKDFQKGLLTGKPLTVRFFEWTTSEPPVPRFPVGITIRDYE